MIGADRGVVVLKRPDVESFGAQSADGVDGSGGAGNGRDAWHAGHHRGPPNRLVVEERLAPQRRVNHHRNVAIDDLVGEARTSFVDLVDHVALDPVSAEVSRCPACGHEIKSQL